MNTLQETGQPGHKKKKNQSHGNPDHHQTDIIYKRLSNSNEIIKNQSSMGSSLSQDLVSAFGQRRAVRSPGDLSKTQSVTTCSTVWVGWPHGHDAASCMPQSWRFSLTRAVPERRRLSHTHCLRGRSAPGGSDGLGGGQADRMKGGPASIRSFHALGGS